MEQNEILEGNKLIAEFMGVEVKTEVKKNDWVKGNKMVFAQSNNVEPFSYIAGWSNHVFPKDNLDEKIKESKDAVWKEISEKAKYHTSWDWLMPVVEKIEGMGYTVVIEKVSCVIDKKYGVPITQTGNWDSKINAVWNAVTGFIKWLNNQDL